MAEVGRRMTERDRIFSAIQKEVDWNSIGFLVQRESWLGPEGVVCVKDGGSTRKDSY